MKINPTTIITKIIGKKIKMQSKIIKINFKNFTIREIFF